jgi:hypothetical protein
MAREQAAQYGIRICSSVAEAVKDVDGIAVIGEHGQYPRSRLGNFQYPRKATSTKSRASSQSAGAGRRSSCQPDRLATCLGYQLVTVGALYLERSLSY